MESVQKQERSVSISVLTIDGQKLKQSFIAQLPHAEFEDVFEWQPDNYCFNEKCHPWGWVKTKDLDVLLVEIDEILYSYIFSGNCLTNRDKRCYEKARYLALRDGEGYICVENCHYRIFGHATNRYDFTQRDEVPFNSYINLISSLPQLFLV